MSDANFDADLDRDNFEKLCGKNGELVELRRKQMLIGAARLLKENCNQNLNNNLCSECPFYEPAAENDCMIKEPFLWWDMPEV